MMMMIFIVIMVDHDYDDRYSNDESDDGHFFNIGNDINNNDILNIYR